MSNCRDCRKPVIFALKENGQRVRLDYGQPNDDGPAYILDGDLATFVPLIKRFEVRQQDRRMYPLHTPRCPKKSRSSRGQR